MIDPVVQSAGGTAVLSYEYEAVGDAGTFRMRCVEVYRAEPDGGWKIINTHWSKLNP